MLDLRELILDTSHDTMSVECITETLTWSDPSYITTQPTCGTMIRINWKAHTRDTIWVLFNYKTTMIANFRTLYGHILNFDSNRAILISLIILNIEENMEKQLKQLQSVILVGLKARTDNINEMKPDKAKIGALCDQYWSEGTSNKILHRSNPCETYGVYLEYDSNEHGAYTYFIGEAVDSLEGQDLSTLHTITIDSGAYMTFTTDRGSIPEIIISGWKNIWAMDEQDLGGKRKYITDFEIYPKDMNLTDARIDIHIGINA